MSDTDLKEGTVDNPLVCSLCGEKFTGWGNNPSPLADVDDRCCDDCNWIKVIPARLEAMGITNIKIGTGTKRKAHE